jgi:hypothetical protein
MDIGAGCPFTQAPRFLEAAEEPVPGTDLGIAFTETHDDVNDRDARLSRFFQDGTRPLQQRRLFLPRDDVHDIVLVVHDQYGRTGFVEREFVLHRTPRPGLPVLGKQRGLRPEQKRDQQGEEQRDSDEHAHDDVLPSGITR